MKWTRTTLCCAFFATALFAQPVSGDDGQEEYQPVIEGLDYSSIIKKNVLLISTGKIDQALDQLEKMAWNKETAKGIRDLLEKPLHQFYGGAGNFKGYEIVAFKEVSSKIYRLYVVVILEKGILVLNYAFIKLDDGWKVASVGFSTVDEFEKMLPLKRVETKKMP